MAGDIADVYLKFQGLTGESNLIGECNDVKHPGEGGWITIKSFNFGFGFQGLDGSADDEEEPSAGTTPGPQKPGAPAAKPKPKRKRKAPAMKSGPMAFDCITFTKGSDAMSHRLMDACHKGKQIDTVELHACRYGGGPDNEKTPFLYLIFTNVHLKTCKLNLATEGMPSEDVEFEYEKVEMKCMWTDNATGAPLPEQPISAGWDLLGQQRTYEDDDFD